MTLQWILKWWNILYAVPLMLALLYLGAYTLSGWTFGEADADADVGADADVDADVHVDVDADADHDAEGDAHEHDTDHATGGTRPHMAALTWLGMGRVPLSLLFMVMFLSWGVIGIVVNQLVEGVVPAGWMSIFCSLPAAVVGSTLSTRAVSGLVARFVPMNETYAEPRRELLGLVGEAVYPIDEKWGMVSVRDRGGNLYQVPCRVEPDRGPIAKGARVLLIGYNDSQRLFFVSRYDVDDAGLVARNL